MLNNFYIDLNFWEQNPHYLIIEPFKTFHKNDKSKGKERSSKVMWAIALLVHPKGKFSDSSYDRRMELISEDYLSQEGTGWDLKYIELINAFKEHCLTRKQRIANMWGDKMDERMLMLEKTSYTIDNFEELDKAMAHTEKIWKVYIQSLKDLEDEDASGQVQGGAEESAEEKGMI